MKHTLVQCPMREATHVACKKCKTIVSEAKAAPFSLRNVKGLHEGGHPGHKMVYAKLEKKNPRKRRRNPKKIKIHTIARRARNPQSITKRDLDFFLSGIDKNEYYVKKLSHGHYKIAYSSRVGVKILQALGNRFSVQTAPSVKDFWIIVSAKNGA